MKYLVKVHEKMIDNSSKEVQNYSIGIHMMEVYVLWH